MPYAIEGLEETLRALRKFSPELFKEMNKEIKPGYVHSLKTRNPVSIGND